MNEATPRNYWLCLFTPTTWQEFLAAGATVSAFRLARSRTVHQMRPGDYLLCYLTGVSRFVAALEVTGEPYDDATPILEDDAFPCRVPVRVVSLLTQETAIPVKGLRDRLSMFRDMKGPNAWTGPFRRSPTKWREADGQVVVEAIRRGDSSYVPGESIPDETSTTAATTATLVVQTTAPTGAQGPSRHVGNVQERPTSGPVVRFGRPPTTTRIAPPTITRSEWDIRDWSLAQINAYLVQHFSARLVTMDQLHPLDARRATAGTPAAIHDPSAGAGTRETAVPAARRAWVGAIPILATGIAAAMAVLAGAWLPAPVRVAATLLLAVTLGFAVSFALVPQSMRLGARFVLTIAVSLGFPAAIGLLLTLVGVPIDRTSLAVGALVIVMLAVLVGVWRGAPAFGQWRTRPFQPLPPVLAILLCAAAVVALGVALAVRSQGLDSTGTSYTTLAVDPATVASGAITVEVVNAEGNPVEYQLDVTDVTDGTVIASDRRVLADAASWQYQLEARPEAGSRLRISLYRVPDVSEAYRELEVVVGEAASNVPASAK